MPVPVSLAERFKVESDERWMFWKQEIPTIKFPPDCEVRMCPPFGGALVRFTVSRGDRSVSVYLDVFDRLGCFGDSYWEIYPYKGDTSRFMMEDVDVMMAQIDEELDRNLLIDGSRRDDRQS